MAGIYIHIPFCKSRCFYCDFYSNTYGDTMKELYIEALCNEFNIRQNELGKRTISTIYLGGGTPSQLSIELLKKIFDCLFSLFTIEEKVEITLEANPDDLSPTFLQELKALPINRISLGVQSFNNVCLQLINRRHTGEEAQNTVKRCQDIGFTNISIDLIYGLPQQDLKIWADDLETAFHLYPTHLSSYALSYEPNTVLWNKRQKGLIEETNEELIRKMYYMLLEGTHQQGYEHYEISNFALPNYYSQHNSSYWNDTPYLGFGPAAHSYNGKNRRWNEPDLKKYIKVNGNTNLPSLSEIEELSTYEHYNDYVMTRLRTMKGLCLKEIEQRFGRNLFIYFKKNAEKHLQTKNLVIHHSTGYIHLSTNGIFISNDVMSDLMYVE